MIKKILSYSDFLILFSTFLPYVINSIGLRFEHILIYFIFIVLLIKGEIVHFKKLKFTSVIFLLFFIIIIISFSTAINEVNFDLEFLATFENYFQTFVLFLIFNRLLLSENFFSIQRMIRINLLFHILLSLNTCLVLMEVLTPYAEYVLPYFVRGTEDGIRMSTSSMGRYMGVYDQTFISGFAYSLGLLTWIYNLEVKRKKNILLDGLILVLILIGGFASVSKVFFIVGILLGVGLFLFVGKTKTKVMAMVFSSVFLFLLAPVLVDNWAGFEYLQELFFGIIDESSLTKITSGRLGNETGIYSVVLQGDFPVIFGKGFTLSNLPFFDSEFVQLFIQGGIIAIFLYFLIILKNFLIWLSLKKVFLKEKALLLAVMILGLVTAFGGPVFLMNRVRAFYFLQLFFLYKMSCSIQNNKDKRKLFNEFSNS